MSSSARRFVLLGLLAIAAAASQLPSGTSTAAFTSSSTNPDGMITAASDWTPPVVRLTSAPFLRATSTVPADASDGESGVKQVVISRSPEDAATWTALCTSTTAPYGCAFSSTTVPDGYYDFQAIATDNSGYEATDVQAGVLVDNTPPGGTLGNIANTSSGTVALTATVNDGGSGVGSVLYQHLVSGSSTWASACAATAAPWSCQFDTTKVPDGSYSFRAVVTDVAGNVTTTPVTSNKRVDNTQSSISVNPVSAFLRGTASISASAFSNAGVRTVTLEQQRVGAATWSPICATTSAPHTCSWNTTSVADGEYLIRATLLDGAGKTTVSTTVPTRVDNTLTRGFDVQAANGGASFGRVDTGDTVTLTYTRAMNLGTIVSGWNGGSLGVSLRLRDGSALGLGAADDSLDVFIGNTQVQLGSVNLRDDYVKAGRTVTFSGTIAAQSATVNGAPATAVRILFGSTQGNKNLRTISTLPSMVWTPSAAAMDTGGAATSGAAVTELGTVDRDL